MKLQIKVDESSGEIVDACFKTFGCGSAIASSSLGKETLVWLLVPWGVSMCVKWIGVLSANVFAYLHSSPSGVVLLLGRGLILWLCGSFGVDQGKAYEWGNKHKEQVSWIQCYHAKSWGLQAFGCMSEVEVCCFCHKLRVQTVWMFCSDIAKHLSLPPVKLHCSMLAEDAIKAAVKDYRQKKEKLSVEAYVHVETAAWSELNVFGFRGLLINVKNLLRMPPPCCKSHKLFVVSCV